MIARTIDLARFAAAHPASGILGAVSDAARAAEREDEARWGLAALQPILGDEQVDRAIRWAAGSDSSRAAYEYLAAGWTIDEELQWVEPLRHVVVANKGAVRARWAVFAPGDVCARVPIADAAADLLRSLIGGRCA